MCFPDLLAFQGPVPLVPLRSRALRTLQGYSGEWAPLPSELSGTCLYRFRKALACPDAGGLSKVLPAGVYRGEGVRGRGGGYPSAQKTATGPHPFGSIWGYRGASKGRSGAQEGALEPQKCNPVPRRGPQGSQGLVSGSLWRVPTLERSARGGPDLAKVS